MSVCPSVRMKTDRQTDTAIDIRFMGSETLPSTCYILISTYRLSAAHITLH